MAANGKVDTGALTAAPARRPAQYTVARSAKRGDIGDGTFAVRGADKAGNPALVHQDGTALKGLPLAVASVSIRDGVISEAECLALIALGKEMRGGSK